MSTVTLEELFAKYETLQRELETAEIVGNSLGAPTTKTQRRLESKLWNGKFSYNAYFCNDTR